MVRPRLLVNQALKTAVLLLLALAAASPSLRAQTPALAAKPSLPIEQLPYRIRLLISVDPQARLDPFRLDHLLSGWQTLVKRFVGAPWQVEVSAGDPSAALSANLETLQAADLAPLAAGFDKVWVVQITAEESGLAFNGRELDVALNRLGPLQKRAANIVRDTPRALFLFTLDLFSPYAEVGETFGKDVNLIVRGASLAPASSFGRVVSEGQIFQPLRVVPQKDGAKVVREVASTFLRVESVAPSGAKCSYVSLYTNPFTKMVVQKTSLAALGVKPGKSPTHLRFITLPDRAPAAGYVLTARNFPSGIPREIGTTDREGRITIDPAGADGLLVIRLLAGSSEPMLELPLMPGLSDVERTLPAFDPKPQAVALETQLEALRDALIDLIAIRARLEARLKARFDGEDWPGAEETLKEFRALPERDKIAEQLTRLKDDSARRQAEIKKPILTKTAQAQIADLQALIDRYLDNETFKGFADALDKLKTAPAAKPKGAAKSAPAPASVAPPPAAVPPKPKAAAPPAAAPATGPF